MQRSGFFSFFSRKPNGFLLLSNLKPLYNLCMYVVWWLWWWWWWRVYSLFSMQLVWGSEMIWFDLIFAVSKVYIILSSFLASFFWHFPMHTNIEIYLYYTPWFGSDVSVCVCVCVRVGRSLNSIWHVLLCYGMPWYMVYDIECYTVCTVVPAPYCNICTLRFGYTNSNWNKKKDKKKKKHNKMKEMMRSNGGFLNARAGGGESRRGGGERLLLSVLLVAWQISLSTWNLFIAHWTCSSESESTLTGTNTHLCARTRTHTQGKF